MTGPRQSPDAAGEGSRFGPYVVLRHLGSGGMAEVDLARIEGPGGATKLLALKRIRRAHANNPMYVRMFLDEARIATALQHPNIIQVHDVGIIEDHPFIAMEYLRGKDLAQVLIECTQRNRHLPLDFALGVICGVCEGLHHAHQMRSWSGEPMQIVHRDVSPDNVFVTYEGHVKLMDFGLAKARNRSTETQVGIIKGTVGYMAPEQYRGQDIDRRLDVFAAGIVLWELVTGQRLVQSTDTRSAWAELNERPVPSPSRLRPECSVALEAVIRRALNKNPDLRYQSAHALLTDLERVAAQQGLWLSASRRAEVMEDLFPGRRARPPQDATAITELPAPAGLVPRTELRSRVHVRRATQWIQQNPAATLVVLIALAAGWVVLGLGWLAATSPAVAAPEVGARQAPARIEAPASKRNPAKGPRRRRPEKGR